MSLRDKLNELMQRNAMLEINMLEGMAFGYEVEEFYKNEAEIDKIQSYFYKKQYEKQIQKNTKMQVSWDLI